MLVALVAFFSSGCQRADAELPPAANATIENGLKSLGAPLLPGNELRLVENGAVFDVLAREIARARRSVNVVMFIWRGEEGPSEVVGRALEARARGVACRILLDPYGSLKFSDDLSARLEKTGCEIRRYLSGALFRAPVLARNHRKIAVIDGEVGVTGGFGIWKSWEGDGLTPETWRDSAVLARGPVVAQMQRAFEQNWRETGGSALPSSDYPDVNRRGRARASFVASSPREGQASAAETMTHLLIQNARRRLWIANSYFVPDEKLQRLLAAKRLAGVDVRVLAPGPVHDIPPLRAAQQATYGALLRVGVRIWEYQPSMMHAKTMMVDDRYAVVGSINFDQLSFDFLEEGSLVTDSPSTARALRRNLEADFERSVEIRPETWNKVMMPRAHREVMDLFSDWL